MKHNVTAVFDKIFYTFNFPLYDAKYASSTDDLVFMNHTSNDFWVRYQYENNLLTNYVFNVLKIS